MGGLKIKKRVPWERVTNVLVMQHALADCVDCKGGGELENNEGVRFVCHCADAPFKKAYEGRLRRTKEGRLEYREMASVPDADLVGAFNAAMTQVSADVAARREGYEKFSVEEKRVLDKFLKEPEPA